MFEDLMARKSERHFAADLYELVLDLFAITQYWSSDECGATRGRLFEALLCRYCDKHNVPMSERPGSRSIRGTRSASGFMHENDAILAFPEFTVQCELKHLSSAVPKNELLIFNQKGIDFLMAEDSRLRRLPLYRIILSGGVLDSAARRFALQWGILVIEPDWLPLLVLHYLSGRAIDALKYTSVSTQDEIWNDIPSLVVPLQSRLRRAARLLDGPEALLGTHRTDWAINYIQRTIGDYYWNALDERDPFWLEARYEAIEAATGGE